MAHLLNLRSSDFTLRSALTGATAVTYTPRGAALSKSGQLVVTLPMTLRRSLNVHFGDLIEVIDTTQGVGTVGYYVVDDRSETIGADGHTATFTCPDLLRELGRQQVPGFSQTKDANGIANEDVPAILARLVAIPAINGEPAWQAVCTTSGFTGVGFTSPPQSVQAAIDKLSQERFAYYRLGANADGTPARIVEFGPFGQSSGLRLVRPSAISGNMNRPHIRPILTLTPKTDAKALVNCLVPTGGGSGTPLTLFDAFRGQTVAWLPTSVPGWQLAAGVAFAGYDPSNYPIYRRIAYDGSGYQHFLINAASIAANRQHWGDLPKSDIAPGGTTANDFAAAGAALYQTAIAELKWTVNPTQVLTLTTLGAGDLRGIAGMTVVVEYPEYVGTTQALKLVGGTTDYSGVYVVVDVTRAVNDDTGERTDTWTLSSTGRAIQSQIQRLTDATKAVDHIQLGGTIVEQQWTEPYERNADSAHPLDIPWDANPSIGSITECTFIVTPQPARANVVGISGDGSHGHSGTLPALAVTATGAGGQAVGGPGQFPHYHRAGGAQGGHDHAGGRGTLFNNQQQGAHSHGGAAYGSLPGGAGTNQGSHNHTGVLAGGTQGSHGHSDSIGVSKSGGVSNATVPNVGGAVANHYHTTAVFGGNTPATLSNAIYVNGNRNFATAAGSATVGTDTASGYGSTDTTHGHGDSISVSKNGGVSTGGGFSPSVGIGLDGGHNPQVGVIIDGAFFPLVTIGADGTIYPTVGGSLGDAYNGFSPWVNVAGQAATGATAAIPLTNVFAGSGQHTHTPIYGVWVDPNYQTATTTVLINGTQYGAVQSGAFTIDLALQLTPNSGATVTFTPDRFCRYVVRKRVRVRSSPVRIG